MLSLFRASLLLLLPSILSCSSGESNTRPKGPPPPSWTGTWTKLDGLAIPPEKRLSLRHACQETPEYWTIEEKDHTVTLELHDATHNVGVKMAVERMRVEKARGPLHKSFAKLEGKFGSVERTENIKMDAIERSLRFPVTYELEYDPKTEHLAGTRNGSPVRFIRADFQEVDRSKCPATQ